MAGKVFQAVAIRGAPLDLFGRMCAVNATGDPSPFPTESKLLKQADVSSISVKAYVNGVQLGATQTPNKTSVFYDTLQTGTVWDNISDKQGGNAHYQVPASLLDSSSLVRIDFEATLADGTLAPWCTNVTVIQPTTTART